MNVTEQILQFALERKIGLNKDSRREDIIGKLGPPDDWSDDQFLFFQDLEIGLWSEEIQGPKPFQNISYFKFKPGSGYRDQFTIPNFIDISLKPRDIDLAQVVQTLVEHKIWFEYPPNYSGDTYCGLRTLNGERDLWFQKKEMRGRKRYLLQSYYCREI